MNPFVIGICGGSGSGKTTLLRKISTHLGASNVSVFTMDNYYFKINKQRKDPKGIVNFDLPTALNEQQLVQDLHRLVDGEKITVQEYFFNSPPDKKVTLTIAPRKVLIVEGLFLFHYPGVQESIDFSVFVDVNMDTQLERRVYRDEKTRGYKKEDIIYQWNNHVTPCYNQFILPYKEQASFVFRNDQNAETDFKRLMAAIGEKLNKSQ
jgi:uridine kinase